MTNEKPAPGEQPMIALTVDDSGVAHLLANNLRPVPGDEMLLRLADIAAILHEYERDEVVEALGGHIFSALDHAVRGSQGCLDDDEFREKRFTALMTHAGFLLGVGL